MSDSEIMLAVTYDEDKVEFPVEISIKLDGVAADFYKTPNGWIGQSRQGKPLPSTAHIIRLLNDNTARIPSGTHIIGELTVMGVPTFKEANGVIKRKKADDRIILNVYDAYVVGEANTTYEKRIDIINTVLKAVNGKSRKSTDSLSWSIVRRVPVVGLAANHKDLVEHFQSLDRLMTTSPMFEGFMIRSLVGDGSHYRVGKRSGNMMRYKPKPTMDLQVSSFEEAVAKDGSPKGMIGRINVLYHKGASTDGNNEYTDFTSIGVGPGTLTHKERTELWNMYKALIARGESLLSKNLICEVEYMLDDAYEALRQPVFKRWRLDKQEASQEL